MTTTQPHVHVLKMGGTIEFIDPAYDAINRQMMKLDSSIENYFQNLIKPHFDWSVEGIVEKDSREITDDDRARLAGAIRAVPQTDILITHGTFTMGKTAHYLEQQYLTDKKIILTGSMIPTVGFAGSDAGFNLGFAIASFTSIEPGVYLSMNGGIFSAGEVAKNESLFRFE